MKEVKGKIDELAKLETQEIFERSFKFNVNKVNKPGLEFWSKFMMESPELTRELNRIKNLHKFDSNVR